MASSRTAIWTFRTLWNTLPGPAKDSFTLFTQPHTHFWNQMVSDAKRSEEDAKICISLLTVFFVDRDFEKCRNPRYVQLDYFKNDISMYCRYVMEWVSSLWGFDKAPRFADRIVQEGLQGASLTKLQLKQLGSRYKEHYLIPWYEYPQILLSAIHQGFIPKVWQDPDSRTSRPRRRVVRPHSMAASG